MIFNSEPFDAAIDDALPLFRLHYGEVADEDMQAPVDVDIDAYKMLQMMGYLRCFTARDHGVLAGYASFLVSASHLHHRGLKYATQDTLFMQREFRPKGLKFMDFIEAELRNEGVRVIVMGIPLTVDWSVLAERRGFKKMEVQMMKWIGD